MLSFMNCAHRLRAREGLPFSEHFDVSHLASVLQQLGVSFRKRTYDPITTLFALLGQCISRDHSCREAVARVLAHRIANGEKPCSPNAGSYCNARKRLPEKLLSTLVRKTGEDLHDAADDGWKWKGRNVVVVDGSSMTADDTPANQAEYPQVSSQKPGLGFPIIRCVALFSLTTGAVLDAAFAKWRGKGTGENSLFGWIAGTLKHGDVLLGDALYDNFVNVALMWNQGVDVVFQANGSRKIDYQSGNRLGQNDHLAVWKRPKLNKRPRWIAREAYKDLPTEIYMREVRVAIVRKGFRTYHIDVVTTLLDAAEYTAEDIAALYIQRWQCELDFRTLKVTMQMGHLRARTPDMVRKLFWAHLLAYNVIRGVMAEAALRANRPPRHVSFKGACQTIEAFAVFLFASSDPEELVEGMLYAIGLHVVGQRDYDLDSRRLKRRPKYKYMTIPRKQAKAMLKAA